MPFLLGCRGTCNCLQSILCLLPLHQCLLQIGVGFLHHLHRLFHIFLHSCFSLGFSLLHSLPGTSMEILCFCMFLCSLEHVVCSSIPFFLGCRGTLHLLGLLGLLHLLGLLDLLGLLGLLPLAGLLHLLSLLSLL